MSRQKGKKLLRDSVVRATFTIDWITLTFNRQKSRDEVSRLAHHYLDGERTAEQRISLWDSFGYVGWDVRGMRWGRREQDDLLQLRGATAMEHWELYAPYASNVSRIDLAATIQFDHHPIAHISEQFETIKTVAEDLPIFRNYSIISPLIGGDTLYVGKRSSMHFGRIYDKGLESNQPEFANCLRWEVEVKKPASSVILELLAQSEDKAAVISAYVHNWFEERLIECPWTPEIAYNAIQFPRVRTTDEKALQWLEKQVSSTVLRLIQRGKGQDVLNVLGLSNITIKGD